MLDKTATELCGAYSALLQHISCLRGKQRIARLLLQAGADASVATGAFDASSSLLKTAATGAVCGMLRLYAYKPSEQRQSQLQPELLPQLQLQLQQDRQADSLIPPFARDSGLLPIHLSCFGCAQNGENFLVISANVGALYALLFSAQHGQRRVPVASLVRCVPLILFEWL